MVPAAQAREQRLAHGRRAPVPQARDLGARVHPRADAAHGGPEADPAPALHHGRGRPHCGPRLPDLSLRDRGCQARRHASQPDAVPRRGQRRRCRVDHRVPARRGSGGLDGGRAAGRVGAGDPAVEERALLCRGPAADPGHQVVVPDRDRRAAVGGAVRAAGARRRDRRDRARRPVLRRQGVLQRKPRPAGLQPRGRRDPAGEGAAAEAHGPHQALDRAPHQRQQGQAHRRRAVRVPARDRRYGDSRAPQRSQVADGPADAHEGRGLRRRGAAGGSGGPDDAGAAGGRAGRQRAGVPQRQLRELRRRVCVGRAAGRVDRARRHQARREQLGREAGPLWDQDHGQRG
mmetsp:Transcript_36305/g.85367  ORF Transcript_36305/g.85367 Transcript_36305/m.85367 type:complete len:346 (+) Transcript_36305:987-2024(+)